MVLLCNINTKWAEEKLKEEKDKAWAGLYQKWNLIDKDTFHYMKQEVSKKYRLQTEPEMTITWKKELYLSLREA